PIPPQHANAGESSTVGVGGRWPSPPCRCPEGSRPTLGEEVSSFWRGGCRLETAGNSVATYSPSPNVGRGGQGGEGHPPATSHATTHTTASTTSHGAATKPAMIVMPIRSGSQETRGAMARASQR